ncbi:MAG: cytochrome c oxidase subunit II [Micavibrio sp.]
MTIMNLLRFFAFSFVLAFALTGLSDFAFAGVQGWQLGFQSAATPVAERLHDFHNFLLVIITAITAFVMVLLLYVMVRFRAKANPVPSMTTHNVPLEIVWTVIPVLILILIAVPSFKLLYYMDRTDDPEMTLKVTGYQWYWGFEYPDHGDISITSNMIKEEDLDLEKGQIRLLSTDNPVILPVDTNIQVIVTAADVLHSFAVPAFGIKVDAVPGRINESWVRIEKPGVYYGQCSELCGQGHAFMPVEVIAVSKDDFAAWVARQNGTADDSATDTTDPVQPENLNP